MTLRRAFGVLVVAAVVVAAASFLLIGLGGQGLVHPLSESSPDWHWTGADLHVVDGYYISTESPCPAPPSDPLGICGPETEIGTAAVWPAKVVAVATARPPFGWVDAAGKAQELAFGGMTKPVFVVLTLADGSRRAMLLLCTPNLPGAGGSVERAGCGFADERFGYWRVGREKPPTSP